MTPFASLPQSVQLHLAALLFVAAVCHLGMLLYRGSLLISKRRAAVELSILLLLLLLLTSLRYGASFTDTIYPGVLLVLDTAVIARSFVCVVQARHRSTDILTPNAVREALNDLEAGIAFSDERGRLVLINHAFRNSVIQYTGVSPRTRDEIEGFFAGTGKPVDETDPMLFILPDGSVRRFQESSLTEQGLNGFTQMSVFDVTALYDNNEALRRTNEELKRTNEALRTSYERLSERIRDQETLRLRMRVHNDMGSALIAVASLLHGESDNDPDRLLTQLRQAVSYFSKREVFASTEWDDVVRQAKNIGIRLELEGNLPEDTDIHLLTAAAAECVTNCARHAAGSCVIVKEDLSAASICYRITNDGQVPLRPIHEGGGLSSLRRQADGAGWQMQILSEPRFELILTKISEEEQR